MRKYFVSYYFTRKNGTQGHGCTELDITGLVRDIDTVIQMGEVVRKRNKFKNAVILNWRRFEEPAALLSAGKGGQ